MTFAAPTIYLAVDALLLADAAYMAVAVDRGVYTAGDVPENQRLTDGGSKRGYTEIGTSNETPDDQFAAEGSDGVLTLVVRAVSKYWGLVLARLVHAALHDKPLPSGVMNPDSQHLVRGSVALVEDFPNPDGGHSVVLRYSTATVSIA